MDVHVDVLYVDVRHSHKYYKQTYYHVVLLVYYGKNVLQNFISSSDGPEKSTETRQRGKNEKNYPIHSRCI